MTTLALQPQIQQTELQSFSQDLLKSWDTDSLANALERVIRIIESGVPPAALAMALQIWYRTLSGNTFTESLQSVCDRSHFSRNYALKGLKLLQSLNVVNCQKRKGQTDEYTFAPAGEWQQYVPPIPDKNDRTNKIVEFPVTQIKESVEVKPTEPIPIEDDPVEDTNSSCYLNKSLTTTTVNNLTEDASSKRWKYVGQGLPRVFLPGELDERTGQMIEKLHEKTQRPVPWIIRDGVALAFEREFGIAIDVMKGEGGLDVIATVSESLKQSKSFESAGEQRGHEGFPHKAIANPKGDVARTTVFSPTQTRTEIVVIPRRDDLKRNGVNLNNQRLLNAAKGYPNRLKTAVDAFLEYARIKQVDSPTNCLIRAIEKDWHPQEKRDDNGEIQVEVLPEDVQTFLMQLKDDGKIKDVFTSGGNGQVWVVLLTGAVIPWREFCTHDKYQVIGDDFAQ
ncbi:MULTISPECIES: hypothetical protein [Nostocales]|uniref:hypothetical protein n=1 Tax=Nostocales TaxID=1161 RepID=UPI000512A130